MAKDEYYVIVCKILVFLYKKLKGQDKRENEEYIVPLSKDFPIDEEYLMYIIEKMVEKKMVEKVNIMKAWGGEVIKIDYSKMRITVEGIDFLRENSVMKKVAETLQEAMPIFSLFQ